MTIPEIEAEITSIIRREQNASTAAEHFDVIEHRRKLYPEVLDELLSAKRVLQETPHKHHYLASGYCPCGERLK